MSAEHAAAFLQRLHDDEEFAQRMMEVSGNPEATHQRAADAGYHFSPDEMLGVLGDAYGVELTTEQLEQIAADQDTATILAGAISGPPPAGTFYGMAASATAVH